MQYDNIYEIKENKKDNNLKTRNLITSNQNKVPNIQKFINLKQRCKKNKNKNLPKREKMREKEKEVTFCMWENYV